MGWVVGPVVRVVRATLRVVDKPWPGPVVALVCSSGGLDGLSQVLGALPPDFAAAVIVAQHVDPTAQSKLAAILDRRSALAVEAATDGAALCPGRALVAPPGCHLVTTTEATVRLFPAGAYPPHRPSADLLLTSLAITARSRAIAVVLSGYGHDGATGATAVHTFGGVVIAASAASSSAPAMPLATARRDDIVDHIADVTDIAPFLGDLVNPHRRIDPTATKPPSTRATTITTTPADALIVLKPATRRVTHPRGSIGVSLDETAQADNALSGNEEMLPRSSPGHTPRAGRWLAWRRH